MMRVVSQKRKRVTGAGKGESEIEKPVRGCGREMELIMAALHSRCGHCICALWSLSIFFSSPNLSGRRLDVYHTSTHGVALVRI